MWGELHRSDKVIECKFYRPYHITAIELKVSWKVALTESNRFLGNVNRNYDWPLATHFQSLATENRLPV